MSDFWAELDKLAQQASNPIPTAPAPEKPRAEAPVVEAAPQELNAVVEAAPPPEVQAQELLVQPAPEMNLQVEIPPDVAVAVKGMHFKLRCEGACTNCAHCGQPLTDSVSQERGIGPICSKKGYLDEVQVSDDTDALLALAPYPQLVEYLTKKYKPQGNRALVNGLVRTASLNRRTPVHGACTDAIEMLGFKRLASALRESLAAVSVHRSSTKPGFYEVWVKSADFTWSWWSLIKSLPGVHMQRYPKLTLVPFAHRNVLAKSIVDYYEGLYLTTDAGSFKITSDWLHKAQAQPADT